ncbi:linear amide C-N hydrolase [Chitinophaga vietnamensis]|uniref:linear amide C-N hydrolase n=1 Tax=Chitinophaga vietnamensis TaxID=2593957 RepID=UPI001375A419|nr:choloylglycine hydrolase family protein [Chitinophaga vietnamensis]
MKKPVIYCLLALLLNIPQIVSACTGIRLKAKNGAIVYARTLEFGVSLPSTGIFVPRGHAFIAVGPEGRRNGMGWMSKYAFAGISAAEKEMVMDGVNEKGLAAGAFYLPGFTEYQDVSGADINRSLSSVDVVGWILSNFATVEEVKQAIPAVPVNKATIAELDNKVVPLHYSVQDAQGNAIVIEYVGGKVNVYDNPVGVITNAPTFDWHLTNLRNYINLSAIDVPAAKLDGLTLAQTGLGSGLLGLPGDFTPPSRFVRAVAFTTSSVQVDNAEAAVDQAFHILDNFDIPKGASRTADKRETEYTLWTSANDLQNKRFYFHTADNRQLQMIDLMKMNLNGRNVLYFSMDEPQAVRTLINGTTPRKRKK